MTIEGRPELQVDWQKQYDIQRKGRLQDVVDDYFQDEEITPRRFYEDLISTVTDIADYHEENLNKAKELLDLLHGTRFKDLEF
jgi:hypothetical protein